MCSAGVTALHTGSGLLTQAARPSDAEVAHGFSDAMSAYPPLCPHVAKGRGESLICFLTFCMDEGTYDNDLYMLCSGSRVNIM